MGKFKDSVRDVFGQLFRHTDVAHALDHEHVDWGGLDDAGQSGEGAPIAPAPPRGPVDSRPPQELMDSGVLPPVSGPLPVAPEPSPAGGAGAKKPIRLVRPGPPAPSTGQAAAETKGKLRETTSRSRAPGPRTRTRRAVKAASASQSLWIEGGSPASRTLSSTRASRTLAPVRGGVALPSVAQVGPPPQHFWDDGALRREIVSAVDAEISAQGGDAALRTIYAALRPAFLSELADLPPLPAVADRLLSSERAPDDDEMERLIRSDAALAGRIVKIANSPFYLSVMPVGSLYSAMMRLGLNQCRRIAMTAALEGAILPPGSVRVFERLRRHGLLTGHIAEALAPAFESDPGEAFLAGLLHDVGDTLVRRAVPTAAQGDPEMDAAVESAALWLHQRVGTLLFAHWDLPAAIAAAIAAHHHPDHADPRFARLAWLIHVADPLAERAQEHSRSKAWQAAASAMAAGSAPPSSDGVELIDVRDLGRAIPGGLPESILHGAARAGLQRMMGADV